MCPSQKTQAAQSENNLPTLSETVRNSTHDEHAIPDVTDETVGWWGDFSSGSDSMTSRRDESTQESGQGLAIRNKLHTKNARIVKMQNSQRNAPRGHKLFQQHFLQLEQLVAHVTSTSPDTPATGTPTWQAAGAPPSGGSGVKTDPADCCGISDVANTCFALPATSRSRAVDLTNE